jgi:hypothetical protein
VHGLKKSARARPFKLDGKSEGKEQIRASSGLVDSRDARDKHVFILGAALAQRLRQQSEPAWTIAERRNSTPDGRGLARTNARQKEKKDNAEESYTEE